MLADKTAKMAQMKPEVKQFVHGNVQTGGVHRL